LLIALATQIHHPLQHGLEKLPNRPATSPQDLPINGAVLPLVPLPKQLLLQAQQFRSNFMARLTAQHAATAFTPLGLLKRLAIAGRLFGGVAKAAETAADPLSQAGQFGRQGGELGAQLLVILSQSY
jgi:hypothetical protein